VHQLTNAIKLRNNKELCTMMNDFFNEIEVIEVSELTRMKSFIKEELNRLSCSKEKYKNIEDLLSFINDDNTGNNNISTFNNKCDKNLNVNTAKKPKNNKSKKKSRNSINSIVFLQSQVEKIEFNKYSDNDNNNNNISKNYISNNHYHQLFENDRIVEDFQEYLKFNSTPANCVKKIKPVLTQDWLMKLNSSSMDN
jgi:hypothetical protein